jgi:hypothetical protein
MNSIHLLHANHPGRANVLTALCAFLARLPVDKSWSISIDAYRAPYSGKQRRSMFGVAYKALMQFSGLQGSADKAELHAFMCGEFFGWKTDVFGRQVPVRSTSVDESGVKNPISTDVAAQFYDFLQRRGADVGCFVPDPDPLWFEKAA